MFCIGFSPGALMLAWPHTAEHAQPLQIFTLAPQDAKSFNLLSMGVAALGASTTAGLTSHDVQRLKMLVSGQGPTVHPLAPLPDTSAPEQAAQELAGAASLEAPEGQGEGADGDGHGGEGEMGGDAMETA